jgi:pimeloyl-ACP methyl ester carboxylesterase
MPCFQTTDQNAPEQPYTLQDYADRVAALLDELGITNTHVIAHSFGCRVAALLAVQRPEIFSRLVFTGAAGIKTRRKPIVVLKIWLYKLRRRLFGADSKPRGSSDYRNLTDVGKITFRNILGVDLRNQIKQITAPTLLVFGENDTATRVSTAKLWTKSNSVTTLTIYKNAGHFCYIQQSGRFTMDVKNFLEGSTA